MANITKSVIAGGGGDYTSLQTAISAADVSSGWYKVEIQDNSTYYHTPLNFNTSIGTPSETNYVWLTVAPANRHSGVAAATGHARLQGYISVSAFRTGARIEYLDIDATASTTHAVGLSQTYGTMVSRCVIHGTWGNGSAGIVIGESHIDNCVIYGFHEGGTKVGGWSGSVGYTLDSCTVYNCGYAYLGTYYWYGGVNFDSNSGGRNIIHNNIVIATPEGRYDYAAGSGSYNPMPNGSHNLEGTGGHNPTQYNNTIDWQTASSGASTALQTSGAWGLFKNLTAGSEDFGLRDMSTASLAANNGVDTIGSEHDVRQDLATDIAGNPRYAAMFDIGAFAISVPRVKKRLAGAWVATA